MIFNKKINTDVLVVSSAVGRPAGYGLDVQVRLLVGQIVQIGSATLPASYPVVPGVHTPGVLAPGVNLKGREPDHSPLTSAEVNKTGIYTSYIHFFIRLRGVVLS
jgi:hypothetical protein